MLFLLNWTGEACRRSAAAADAEAAALVCMLVPHVPEE
jgi:hypothetical protein